MKEVENRKTNKNELKMNWFYSPNSKGYLGNIQKKRYLWDVSLYTTSAVTDKSEMWVTSKPFCSLNWERFAFRYPLHPERP